MRTTPIFAIFTHAPQSHEHEVALTLDLIGGHLDLATLGRSAGRVPAMRLPCNTYFLHFIIMENVVQRSTGPMFPLEKDF